MTIIRTSANATEYMKAILSKTVTPIDVAKLSSCTGMFVSRTDFVDDSDSVGKLLNIANTSNNFKQDTDANKPSMQYDSIIGRDTLNLSSDSDNQYMLLDDNFDYTGEFTLLIVARMNSAEDDLQALIGNESATSTERVAIELRYGTTANIVLRYGTSATEIKSNISNDQYYCFIMSFDGSSTATGEAVGDDAVTVTTTDTLTTTQLGIGSSTSSFGIVDSNIDMVCLFNKNLHDTDNESDLETVKTMLSDFYGDTLYGN